MPEVWIPYGGVETLVTIQAENLGATVEPASEGASVGPDALTETLKGGPASIFACDTFPTTASAIKDALNALNDPEPPRIYSTEPKKLESLTPDLKGRVSLLGRAQTGEGVSQGPLQDLAAPGRKLFVATAHPDPFFGLTDARVQTALNWVAGTSLGSTRNDFEPTPFELTESYEESIRRTDNLSDSAFFSIVPRGGRLHQLLVNAHFDAIKSGFMKSEVSPARGLIIGVGGRGYDDTLSSALRMVWSAIGGVKRGGEVLLVSECSDGLGSPALDMFASGRIQEDRGKRREKHVQGMEEIFYLSKLKEDYGVLLLSGLPEIFAKSKLGLSTARGSGEAVGRLINKLGRTAKINLVTRTGECRVTSA